MPFLFCCVTRERLAHRETVVKNIDNKIKQKKIQLEAAELRHRKLLDQLAAVEKIRASNIKDVSALNTKVTYLTGIHILFGLHVMVFMRSHSLFHTGAVNQWKQKK